MILLVHSCDSREWLWEYWWRFFFKHRPFKSNLAIDFIRGNEMFSDQLIDKLNKMDDEYIWYTLDDFWIQEWIDFEYYWKFAKDNKMDALRLQPNVQHNSIPYRFDEVYGALRQREDSAYTMSMQTSIWRREYFLECLTPGLDPWELERTRPKLGNVYFVPRLPFWYIDATCKGVLTDKAKKLI